MNRYVAPTQCFDYKSPALVSFVEESTGNLLSKRQKTVALYYAVRDTIRYYPYELQLTTDALKGSTVLKEKKGHCIAKATLFITSCRSIGVPARLGLAKVVNHIGVAKLRDVFRTGVLAPHGYVELLLDGEWVKATPTFNKELCHKLGVKPLDFDGRQDALFQEYDGSGRRFMEYMEYYGTFDHVPIELIVTILRNEYPYLFDDYDEGKRKAGVDLIAHYKSKPRHFFSDKQG